MRYSVLATAHNKRVPPALATLAPENAARVASRVGTLERYKKSARPDVVRSPGQRNNGQLAPEWLGQPTEEREQELDLCRCRRSTSVPRTTS